MGLVANAIKGMVMGSQDPVDLEESLSKKLHNLKSEYASAEVELDTAYAEKKTRPRLRKLMSVEDRYVELIESFLKVSKHYSEKSKEGLDLSELKNLLREVEARYAKIRSIIRALEEEKILSED